MAEFLVVSPHLDDEALGCGGILDDRFHVFFCGVEHHRIVDRDTRLSEAEASAELLGFSYTVNLENTVNDYRKVQLIGQIETEINQHQPTTVFLPCPSYNQDHVAVLDSGLVAVRPHDLNHHVRNVLLYEQVHAAAWPHRSDLIRGRGFQPSCFFRIDIERKVGAYLRHASQVRAMRSPETVRALAAWRGTQAGCDFAEGYQAVRLTDPAHLTLGRRWQASRADETP